MSGTTGTSGWMFYSRANITLQVQSSQGQSSQVMSKLARFLEVMTVSKLRKKHLISGFSPVYQVTVQWQCRRVTLGHTGKIYLRSGETGPVRQEGGRPQAKLGLSLSLWNNWPTSVLLWGDTTTPPHHTTLKSSQKSKRPQNLPKLHPEKKEESIKIKDPCTQHAGSDHERTNHVRGWVRSLADLINV